MIEFSFMLKAPVLERAQLIRKTSAKHSFVAKGGHQMFERHNAFNVVNPSTPTVSADFMANGSTVEASVISSENVERINSHIAQLPPHEQIYLRLRALYGPDSIFVNDMLKHEERFSPRLHGKQLDIDEQRLEEIRQELLSLISN